MSGFDRSELVAALENGPVVRVVIAQHAGSAPRETGTSMLVFAQSEQGTIGGGALELQAIQTARKMLQSQAAAQVLKLPLGPALGQCCGGSVTLVLERITNMPRDREIYVRRITGAATEPLSITRAVAQMRNLSDPRRLVFTDGWLAEATSTAFRPLWLYGAGHVGRAIVETLNGLPFDITWIDTAQNRFPTQIPPNATPLIAANPAQAVAHAPANADHLVLTYSHAIDLDLCHAILSRDFASLGVIGSATKKARFTKRLRALGHSDRQISRMICPVGDRALGKTPKAIAVGIAADLLSPAAQHFTRKEA
jgi:xanthine dehydrogenase accessory factor